ncbi:MAG: isoleucine--tRNA ligase, partial [Verrucomicrobia subdivision 3 bacterium]|nr:isoleucine--tRNA ligase [Limisphaerales bacterium]
MDYKDTLNLPRTDFAMKADLVTREPLRLEKWQKEDLYAKIQAARADAPKFVLHDGPPFANGDVHIGTALNKILKDIVIKYKSLRGFSAPYIPGWDCHGLPIEFKVSQEMRKAGDTNADAATVRKACDAYAHKYIDLQRTQFKRLGVLGDWDHPYLTLSKEYEADELRLFADIVEQGFVYRGKKPVYWSIPCRTALAEAEVEYADHVSQSVFVKFPVLGRPGVNIVIWTTTPWTLPANLAVAYSSTFSYSLVQVGEEQFIVSALLLSTVAQKCGWQDYQIVRSLDGEDLKSLEYQHPFCNRTGKLYAGDNFITNDTGTGFVHIAPGHGLDDYHIGRQNGLPIYSPVNDDGALAHTNELPVARQMPAGMLGKSILEKHGKSDANEAVLHELRVRKALLHQENYHHSYPHCWRSKTPVIFRAMDQWFIKIDHMVGTSCRSSQTAEAAQQRGPTFREQALAEIDRVSWIPDWGVNRIKGAVQSRPDWCISRQRTWGVPIPAFYNSNGEPILDAQIVRNAAALIEQHGSNVWFEKSVSELWSLVKPANWAGEHATAKSNDTLDVWIDSGSSSRAVLMRRGELNHSTLNSQPSTDSWQADMYLEGSDQHRGWFQSSLLLSLAGNGAAPFKTVLTHGFMVDADREKISKSKQGAYEKPQTAEAYVKKYGADVVRLWVASQDFRNDIVVSEERVNKVGETYRGIRNALRYQLSNLYDFDPAKHTVPNDQLTGLDRWILGEFSKLEQEVIEAYDKYEFHVVYQKVSQFVAVELSSIYHDVIKDRLYTDAANSLRRRSTQTVLHRLVTGLCQMLSPMLAFTTDEAWEFVPGRTFASVHGAAWEPVGFTTKDYERESWKSLFLLRELALPELEKARQAKQIGKSLEAKLTLNGTGPLILDAKVNLDSL